MKRKQSILNKNINLGDGKTTPGELIRETLINFSWGFAGNSITLFMAKEIDAAVFINFFVYYVVLSYIINRAAYETRLGKMVILPGSAALGAFSGYKFAQFISTLL
jgi:hypothetical protein